MTDPAATGGGLASAGLSITTGAAGVNGQTYLADINEYLQSKTTRGAAGPALQAEGPKSILFRPVQWTESEAYDGSYNKLQSWICNSLETYKPELLGISFPVFVHSFVRLVERGFTEEASAFLKKWSPEHLEYHEDEIRSLTVIQRPDQLEGHSYVQRIKTEKFVVRLCVMSYRLLESFLSENSLLIIMEILNERVKIIVEDRPPRLKRDIICLGDVSTGGVDRAGRAAETVRWRMSATNRTEATELPEPKDSLNENLGMLRKTRLTKYLHVPDNTSGDPVAAADASSPTVLMATVSNTYDNLVCARITTDATQVACGFQDRAIRVYRLMDAEGPAGSEPLPGSSPMNVDGPYKGPLVLRGHSQPVYGLSWSPEQRHLLSASGDGTVRLWDVASGKNLAAYRGPSLWPVWDVCFSPMGHYFATASYNRAAMIWTTSQVHPVRLLVGHYSDVSCVTWHPNCNYVATGSWDKSARLWDVQTGKCVRVFNGHIGALTAITVSPDGKYLAAAGGGVGGAGTIRIWEIAGVKEVAVLDGHSKSINRLAYSRDGKVLTSGGMDDSVRTWDVDADLHLLNTAISIPPIHTFMTRGTPVYDVAFTNKNLLLAVGAI